MEIQILLLALLPSVLVLLAGLLSYRYLANSSLQAYERLTLLMERISPESLLLRCMTGELTTKQYEGVLIANIREEWEHNLSQQIYVSHEVWQLVCQAKGNVSKMITMCGDKVHPQSPAIELSNMILAMLLEMSSHPTAAALSALRGEASRLM